MIAQHWRLALWRWGTLGAIVLGFSLSWRGLRKASSVIEPKLAGDEGKMTSSLEELPEGEADGELLWEEGLSLRAFGSCALISRCLSASYRGLAVLHGSRSFRQTTWQQWLDGKEPKALILNENKKALVSGWGDETLLLGEKETTAFPFLQEQSVALKAWRVHGSFLSFRHPDDPRQFLVLHEGERECRKLYLRGLKEEEVRSESQVIEIAMSEELGAKDAGIENNIVDIPEFDGRWIAKLKSGSWFYSSENGFRVSDQREILDVPMLNSHELIQFDEGLRQRDILALDLQHSLIRCEVPTLSQGKQVRCRRFSVLPSNILAFAAGGNTVVSLHGSREKGADFAERSKPAEVCRLKLSKEGLRSVEHAVAEAPECFLLDAIGGSWAEAVGFEMKIAPNGEWLALLRHGQARSKLQIFELSTGKSSEIWLPLEGY